MSGLPLFLGIPTEVLAALVIAPGFFFHHYFRLFGRTRSDETEATQLISNALIGVVLLPFSYVLLVVLSNLAAGVPLFDVTYPRILNGTLVIQQPPATGPASIDAAALFLAYVTTVGVASVTGGLIGWLYSRYRTYTGHRLRSNVPTWDHLHTRTIAPAIVQITTETKEIWGLMHYAGEDDHDIVLKQPRQVEWTDGKRTFTSLGKVLYLSPDEIDEMSFRTTLKRDSPVSGRSFLKRLGTEVYTTALVAIRGPPPHDLHITEDVEHRDDGDVVHVRVRNLANRKFSRVSVDVIFEADDRDSQSVLKRHTEELLRGETWTFTVDAPSEFPTYHGVQLSNTETRLDPLAPSEFQTVERNYRDATYTVRGIVESRHQDVNLAYVELYVSIYDRHGTRLGLQLVGIDGLATDERRPFSVTFVDVNPADVADYDVSVVDYWPIRTDVT